MTFDRHYFTRRHFQKRNHIDFSTAIYFRTETSFRDVVYPHEAGNQQVYYHDEAIKWKLFPRFWNFVRGIHRSPVSKQSRRRWFQLPLRHSNVDWLSRSIIQRNKSILWLNGRISFIELRNWNTVNTKLFNNVKWVCDIWLLVKRKVKCKMFWSWGKCFISFKQWN